MIPTPWYFFYVSPTDGMTFVKSYFQDLENVSGCILPSRITGFDRGSSCIASRLFIHCTTASLAKTNPVAILCRVLGPQSSLGTSKTNRWMMFAPAFATHIALGASYGWSAVSATVGHLLIHPWLKRCNVLINLWQWCRRF